MSNLTVRKKNLACNNNRPFDFAYYTSTHLRCLVLEVKSVRLSADAHLEEEEIIGLVDNSRRVYTISKVGKLQVLIVLKLVDCEAQVRQLSA